MLFIHPMSLVVETDMIQSVSLSHFYRILLCFKYTGVYTH